MKFKRQTEQVRSAFQTPFGQKVLNGAQRIFLLALIGWLLYELNEIGWRTIWHSLPVHPLFYLLILFTYIQLPLAEILIYRVSWKFRALASLPAFLLKRVYNRTLLGYSGELYFYTWARKLPGLSGRDVFMTIKDNNILSSIASTLVAFGLLIIFLLTGQIQIFEWIASQSDIGFWVMGLGTVMAVTLMIHFRNSILTMSMRDAWKIFLIQIARLLLLQTVNVLIYYIAIPDAPLEVWFTLISVEIILSRIPLLPNRDLIFIGMSIGLAAGLTITEEEIAGLMVAKTAFNKLAGLVIVSFLAFTKADQLPEEPELRDEPERS